MSKNIQTKKADKELVKKFLDYANVADASYAFEISRLNNASNEKYL